MFGEVSVTETWISHVCKHINGVVLFEGVASSHGMATYIIPLVPADYMALSTHGVESISIRFLPFRSLDIFVPVHPVV